MATAALALFVAACGGSPASEDGQRKSEGSTATTAERAPKGGEGGEGEGGSTATTARPPGSDGKKPGGSSTAKDGGGGAGGQGGTAPTEKPKQPLPIELSLKSACVKAGGSQSITIKVPAGSGVAYDSYYADGKSGLHEGFYGGNNGKVVDNDDGTWTDTWVVAAHAPPGKVRVAVLAGHMDYQSFERDLFFDLVPPTGTCP